MNFSHAKLTFRWLSTLCIWVTSTMTAFASESYSATIPLSEGFSLFLGWNSPANSSRARPVRIELRNPQGTVVPITSIELDYKSEWRTIDKGTAWTTDAIRLFALSTKVKMLLKEPPSEAVKTLLGEWNAAQQNRFLSVGLDCNASRGGSWKVFPVEETSPAQPRPSSTQMTVQMGDFDALGEDCSEETYNFLSELRQNAKAIPASIVEALLSQIPPVAGHSAAYVYQDKFLYAVTVRSASFSDDGYTPLKLVLEIRGREKLPPDMQKSLGMDPTKSLAPTTLLARKHLGALKDRTPSKVSWKDDIAKNFRPRSVKGGFTFWDALVFEAQGKSLLAVMWDLERDQDNEWRLVQMDLYETVRRKPKFLWSWRADGFVTPWLDFDGDGFPEICNMYGYKGMECFSSLKKVLTSPASALPKTRLWNRDCCSGGQLKPEPLLFLHDTRY